ncbi:MAG TPA: dihydroorotate dehydrogenase, partial [Candidatus Bathyarchaeota archaeon]|nr:dihydroorotate dehydrogenase [Candidatus Bathyarchaeota archaeon]
MNCPKRYVNILRGLRLFFGMGRRGSLRATGSKRLEVELAGLRMSNPTMLAAGVLGTTAELLRRAIQSGAGAVVTKSVGLKPRKGYPNPSVIQVKCGFLNAVGLSNPGIHNFIDEMKSLRGVEAPVIVSVYGYSTDEYVEVSLLAADAGASAIELNLSCPHVKGSGLDIGGNPAKVREIVEAVKNSVSIPVIAKLSPNVQDIVEIALSAWEGGVDAVTAINTIRGMAIDIETAKPILANKIGGLSGPAIKPVAVRCIYEIYEAVNAPIIGCGGIET